MSLRMSLLVALHAAASGQEPAPSPPQQPRPPSQLQPTADDKSGTFEFIAIDSKILARAVEVGVYLPWGYAAAKERYPSLYFFHGRNGISRELKQRKLPGEIDRLIASGELPPTVIAFPNCDGSMYVDWRNGKAPWQEFFAIELIAAIDAKYRTIADRALRGAEGDAAGGLGALLLAFRHPELFGAVGTHAASMFPLDPSQATERLLQRAGVMEPVFGWPIDADHWKRCHPLELARTLPVDSLKQLKIYFDCGERDREGFDVTNGELHEILESRGVPHEWHLRPASARRDFLQENLQHSLRFHGRQFAEALRSRQQSPTEGR